MSLPRILALDLSLTRSGVCEPDGTTSCIVPGALRGMERIDHIVRRVQALARGVDLVVCEGYSFGSKGRAVFSIAEMGGCVRFLLHRLGVPYVDVAPGSLKKWATGNGGSAKVDMVVAARERFGLEGTTDDNRADAYLLWAMARHAFGDPIRKPTQYQVEALAKVDWPRLPPLVVHSPQTAPCGRVGV